MAARTWTLVAFRPASARVGEFAGTEADEVSRRQRRDRRPATVGDVDLEHDEPFRLLISVQADRGREMVLVHVAGQQDTDAPDVVADEFVALEFLVDRANDPRRILATRLVLDSPDQR